jgi:hypothetical protein
MKKTIITTLSITLAFIAIAQNTFTKTEFVRFSPDGKQLVLSSAVYQSSTTAGVPAKRISARIAMMNVDGSNLKWITSTVSGKADASPAISTDGKKIVFRRDNLNETAEPGDIYIINTDGSGLKQLSAKAEQEKNPEFTADGKGVIFIREYFKNIGKARDGELIHIDLATGQEKILLPKEMRVVQAIPLTIGRGGLLLACAETNDQGQPLPAGSMLAMASPDGEISDRSKMILPGKVKMEIKQARTVIAGQQLIFYVHATEGSGWFAEDANFKITAGQTQKLTARGYYSDINLSPDGKTGVQGNEGEATIKLWDFANDQFSNKRTVTGK